MTNQEHIAEELTPPQALSDPLSQNIADILELEKRELAAANPAQRRLEEISRRVQKVTKLIHLLEELRGDFPSAPDRSDPHVAELKKPTDAVQVMSAPKSTQRND